MKFSALATHHDEVSITNLGLHGKRAIVTGGSAGIGAAIVEVLAGEGCDVWFCARNPERIAALETAVTHRRGPSDGVVSGTVVDVADREAAAAWLDSIGAFDLAIANVSALSGDWAAALRTDLQGTVNLIEECIPRIAQDGAITYVGSKAAGFGTPGFEAYGAIKAAMAHYVKSTAIALTSRGIRTNVVSPGGTFVEGGFWDGIRRAAPEICEAMIQANPMGRLAKPEEIANVVAFVSSPVASFVSGANWSVDGGSTTHVQF